MVAPPGQIAMSYPQHLCNVPPNHAGGPMSSTQGENRKGIRYWLRHRHNDCRQEDQCSVHSARPPLLMKQKAVVFCRPSMAHVSDEDLVGSQSDSEYNYNPSRTSSLDYSSEAKDNDDMISISSEPSEFVAVEYDVWLHVDENIVLESATQDSEKQRQPQKTVSAPPPPSAVAPPEQNPRLAKSTPQLWCKQPDLTDTTRPVLPNRTVGGIANPDKQGIAFQRPAVIHRQHSGGLYRSNQLLSFVQKSQTRRNNNMTMQTNTEPVGERFDKNKIDIVVQLPSYRKQMQQTYVPAKGTWQKKKSPTEKSPTAFKNVMQKDQTIPPPPPLEEHDSLDDPPTPVTSNRKGVR